MKYVSVKRTAPFSSVEHEGKEMRLSNKISAGIKIARQRQQQQQQQQLVCIAQNTPPPSKSSINNARLADSEHRARARPGAHQSTNPFERVDTGD